MVKRVKVDLNKDLTADLEKFKEIQPQPVKKKKEAVKTARVTLVLPEALKNNIQKMAEIKGIRTGTYIRDYLVIPKFQEIMKSMYRELDKAQVKTDLINLKTDSNNKE